MNNIKLRAKVQSDILFYNEELKHEKMFAKRPSRTFRLTKVVDSLIDLDDYLAK